MDFAEYLHCRKQFYYSGDNYYPLLRLTDYSNAIIL